MKEKLTRFELLVLMEKNESTNERKLKTEIEKLVLQESPLAGNQPRAIQKIPVMPRFAKKDCFFAFPHNSLKILMKLFDFL